MSEETERGWSGEPIEDGGVQFSREVRGVREVYTIDGKLIASSDARRLDQRAGHLQEIYAKTAILKRKDTTIELHSPTELLDAVFAAGRKGISLQRYKGLGEMNPEQLWETTLDDNVRSLLKVHVRELDEADDMFTKLMGDVVEPRRDFIKENALAGGQSRRLERRYEFSDKFCTILRIRGVDASRSDRRPTAGSVMIAAPGY